MLPHPRLIVTVDQIPAIREFVGRPLGRRLARLLADAFANEPDDGIMVGSHAAGKAFWALLHGDQAALSEAEGIIEETLAGVEHRDSPPLWASNQAKMIFRTRAAVDLAIAYDLAFDLWKPAFRRRLAGELEQRAREFLAGGGPGFNPIRQSNWVGNTQAAAGFIALAIAGDEGVRPDAEQMISEARAGFFRWISHAFGDHGWPVEGINYLRYPMTTSGFSFLQALSIHERQCPVIGTKACKIMPLYLSSLVRPPASGQPPYLPFFGLSYPAGDQPVTAAQSFVERSRWRSGDMVMAMGSADPRYLPAAKWTLEQVFGSTGTGCYQIYKPTDAVYAICNLAGLESIPSAVPDASVARCWWDQRTGHGRFRSRFRDADDCVIDVQSNLEPVPGVYSFQDAGSFRLYGMGTRWADQCVFRDEAGRILPTIARQKENVVHIPGTNGRPGGRLLQQVCTTDGGQVTLDLSQTYGTGRSLRDAELGRVRATRSMAVRLGADGRSFLFAVADRITGAANACWLMHTAGIPLVEEDGFSVRGGHGASLRAWTLGVGGDAITVRPGPDTSTIAIELPEDARIVVVMNMQPGPIESQPQAAVTASETGWWVDVGGRRIVYREPDVWIDG